MSQLLVYLYLQKRGWRKSRRGNCISSLKRNVARTEGYEFSEHKGPVYRLNPIEPRHIIVKFQHTQNKEGILKYTSEKRSKSHQIIRIRNVVELLNKNTGTQKIMENFEGKKNLQKFCTSQTIKQIWWHHESIFRLSRSPRPYLKYSLSQGHLQDFLQQNPGVSQRSMRFNPGETQRGVPAQ